MTIAAGKINVLKTSIFYKLVLKLRKILLLRRRDGRVVDCGGLENR